MKSKLTGKKILFIGPETFNYEKEIVREMEKLGAQVAYRSDKPGNSFILKVLLRLFPKILWNYSDRVFGRWLALDGPDDCDVVLVIKGEGLSPKFIDVLKNKYQNAKFIFYLWDSINNVRNVELKLSKFDHLYSFDPHDCKNNSRFKYRPLFFLERYRSLEANNGSGCFFIGTLNGDRPAVISRLIRSFQKEIEFNYWLFVRSKIELQLRRLFDPSLRVLDQSRLLNVPMPSAVVSQNFQCSAAIIDIEHPSQVGLTMRTFEVLASGKKLVTTNRNIVGHDFYDPNRICIINRSDPKLDPNFVSSPMAPLSEDFYKNYSLQGWMLNIFECVISEESA